jgi:hypothetical protein
MAIDMNDYHRTNMRIDELEDRVDERFREIEDRRRSVQFRIAGVLTIALYMALSFALGRAFAVNDPGAACESKHPTTDASRP